MNFNYRIIRRTQGEGKGKYTNYQIHEVTYDENGKVFLVTEEAEFPCGADVKDLMSNWYEMLEAFSQPILDWDNIPEEGSENIFEGMLEDIEINPERAKSFRTLDEVMDSFGITEEDLDEARAEDEEDRKIVEVQYNRENVGTDLKTILHNIQMLFPT